MSTEHPSADELLRRARDFIGKSRCSVGHSVSDVWDNGKFGRCIYCAEQRDLHIAITGFLASRPAVEPLGIQVACKRCVCGHFKSEHSGETNTCNFEYCGCLHYEHGSTLIATKEQMAADAGPLTVAGLVYAESQNGQDEYARVRGLDDKQIVSEGLDSTSQLMRELANRYDVACEKLDNTAHETTACRLCNGNGYVIEKDAGHVTCVCTENTKPAETDRPRHLMHSGVCIPGCPACASLNTGES